MESAATFLRRDDEENGSERPALAVVTTVKRPRPAGGGGRGAGYSAPEVSFYLSLLEEHLPVTHKEWRAVARLHNAQFPSLRRTPNSLRRKFTALCRLFTGGDETVIAPDVRRAVNVKRRMKNRGDVPDEDEESEPDSMEGDVEDEPSNGAQRRRESSGEAVPAPGATTGPQQVVAINPRYYPMATNPQPTPAVPVPPLVVNPSPAPVPTASRAQAMYDRLAETTDRRTGNANGATTSTTELLELIKMQLLQNVEDDRRRRAEELERREEERRNREEERAVREEYRRRWEEERARRQEDLRRWEQEREESRRRHEDYMQLILSLIAKK